jgi:hypothetical protein
MNESDQLNVPSVYDRVSQPLAPDQSARHEFSDCYNDEAQERERSRREHDNGRSHHEVPHESPPMTMYISDCSSDISSTHSYKGPPEETKRKSVQLEVYPGAFLELRGAKETLEAIERGHSKSVFCSACCLGLRCVADCDLVICPDCRLMSPVPRRPAYSLFEDGEQECEDNDRGSLPQCTPLWGDDEDDGSFHSSKPKSNMRSQDGSSVGFTGGVGLGLRIEH